MAEWTENFIGVIPISSRDDIATVAQKIMPDVNEGVMFDSIRLSPKGSEPATHLATVCPMKKDLAEKWRQVLLPLGRKPEDYPRENTGTADKFIGTTVMLDSKSTAIITDRLEGLRVKAVKTVRLIDTRRNMTEVRDIDTVFTALGLVRILPDEEV